MKKNILNIGSFFLATLVVFSCGQGSSNSNKKVSTDDLQQFVETQFDYPIPTSYEVANMLQRANANFVFNITLDPKKANSYVAEWQKAMVLGIYGADLSYASTYNRQDETVQFLAASRKLIEDLNIGTAFNSQFADRVERNLENKDSLILIVTESFYDTYNYLNRNGEEKTSLLVIAGSVIEGLHITSQLIIGSNYNDELLGVLASQKDQIKKLVELMDAHADDENVNRVLPKLRFIDLYFDQLGASTSITKGQFDDIYDSIRDMRATVIK